MPTLDAIRTLTIQARSVGFDQVTADANKLAGAQSDMQTSADAATKSTLSMEAGLASAQR
jgi:hypothetical protein